LEKSFAAIVASFGHVLLALLDRNSLHQIPRDLPLAAVVEPSGPGIGVAGEVLDIVERGAVLK